MVKNLWECSVEECGEKAVVPEDSIPTGWIRLDYVYHNEKCTDCIPGGESNIEEAGGCILTVTIEACCKEHAKLSTDRILDNTESMLNWIMEVEGE